MLNFFNHDKQLYIDFLDGDLTNEFDKVRFYCPEGNSSPSVRRGSIYFDSTSHIGIDEMKTQQMQVQSACDSHIRQIQDSNQNLQQKIDTALEQYAGNYKNRGKTFLSQRRSYKFWSELSTLISQNSQAPYNWSAFVDLGFELFPRKNDKSMSALLLNAEAESDNIISHYKNKVRGLALTSQCNRLTVQYKQVDDALLWEHKQYDDEILKRELDCNKVEIFFEELNHLSRLNEVKTKIETQADKKKLGDCLNRITKSNSLQDIHNLKQRAINIGLNRSNSAGQLTEMMYRVSKGADDRGRILLLSKVEDTGLELTDFDENITEALSRQMSDSELVKRYCNRLQVLVKEETECLRELKEYMAKQVQIANEILNHKGWLQRVGLTQHNVGVCDAVKEIKSAMITYLQGAHLAHDQLVRFQQQLKTCQQVISASSSVREKNQQINLMIERVSQARDTKQKLAAARTTLVTVIERRLGQSSFQRHHSFIVDWMRYLAGALKNILSGRKISQANSRYTKAKRWSNNLNSFFKQPSTTGGEQRVVVACKA